MTADLLDDPEPSALAQALDRLDLADGETLSAGSQTPGEPFKGSRVPVAKLRTARFPATGNYWVGLCPIPGDGPGRGTAAEVLRVPALWVDVDVACKVKPAGGMPTGEAARDVVADLSRILGSEPVYVTHSGHGLQPVWAVDGEDSRDVDRARRLARRWGLLARRVAQAHGGDLDTTSDLARVLRAPGSVNMKDPDDPVPTRWEPRNGRPLSWDEVADALDAHGVPEVAEDDVAREAVPAGSWPWAERTCHYVRAMVDAWAGDEPTARHPWLMSATIRLAAAHRLGCLTEDDQEAAVALLGARMDALRAHDGRRPDEVAETVRDAVGYVETYTEAKCRNELGDHSHDRPAPTLIDVEEARGAELDEGSHRTVPLGRRMAREWFLGRFIYVPRVGWHAWDGRRWEPVETDRALAAAADWSEAWILGLVRSRTSSDVVKAALRYREVGAVAQLVAGARTEAAIVVDAGGLDAHPGLLNARNGVVDLRTGELRPHDPALRFTKVTGSDYVPGAKHPDWDKALGALPDTDTAYWVQVHTGSAASGEPDRTGPVAFHRGDGANGKSALVGAIRAALADFATLVSDQLLAGRQDGHPTVLMPLRGARLAYLEELPEDHVLPVARIKKLAETAELSGRLIGQDFVTWTATHALLVTTNYTPRVAEVDHGTWRRLAMVPYPHTFEGEACDPGLRRRLRSRAQMEAVLAWIVEGAQLWYTAGRELPDPSAVMAQALEEWREEGDPLAEFLREQIDWTGDPEDRIPTGRLLDLFNGSLPIGTHRWSAKLFGSRLRAHQVVRQRRSTVDRGASRRLPTALTGARLADPARVAQGEPRGSLESSSRETSVLTLRNARRSTKPTPECRACGEPMPFGDVNADGLHPSCPEPGGGAA